METLKMRQGQREQAKSVELPALDEKILVEDVQMRQVSERIEKEVETTAVERHLGRLGAPRNLIRAAAAGLFMFNMSVADVYASERKAEQEFSDQQQRDIEKAVGVAFPELKDSFSIEMPVTPGPEGKYVIHIGQSHQHPGDFVAKAMTNTLAIKAQKQIENLITSSVDANRLQCVFDEGVAEEQVPTSLRNYVQKANEEIGDALERPINTMDDFQTAVNTYQKFSKGLDHPIVFNFLGKKVDALRAKSVGAAQNLHPQEEYEKVLMEAQVMGLQMGAMTKSLSGFMNFANEENPYLAGALWKLFMENRVDKICPTEDQSLNERALAALQEKTSAYSDQMRKSMEIFKEMRGKDAELDALYERRTALLNKGDKLTVEERQENDLIVTKLQEVYEKTKEDPRMLEAQRRASEAETAFDRLAHIEREQQMLAWLDKYDLAEITTGKAPGNVVVVFGRAHDFSTALNDWNRADSPHHPIRRGLIKISPKE